MVGYHVDYRVSDYNAPSDEHVDTTVELINNRREIYIDKIVYI